MRPRPGRDRFDVGADLLDDEVLAAGQPRWANLGDWSTALNYRAAARDLALRVGRAAGLSPGARVLDLACGEGASLALWREAFGAGPADGIELDPRRARVAAGVAAPTGEVVAGSALEVLAGRAARPGYDAVVCVDAAYHLGPLEAVARACAGTLAPGGRVAFTTLAWPAGPPRRGLGGLAAGAALRAAAVPRGAVVSLAAIAPTLHAAGLEEITVERLDHAVLGGFARWVARRGPQLTWRQRRSARWTKVALTARLCRWATLSYVLVSALRGADVCRHRGLVRRGR